MHPFRFAVQVSSLPLPGWRERVRWYEQLGFSALHTLDHFDLRQWDPLATQAAVAGATTRAATGATVIDVGFYHPMVLARCYVVFDPSFNYARPEGSPVLPGDTATGAADRYMEALSESVIRPLAGQ